MIEDNGQGFDLLDKIDEGNGITNMKLRAEEIGFLFHIESKEHEGCTIRVNKNA